MKRVASRLVAVAAAGTLALTLAACGGEGAGGGAGAGGAGAGGGTNETPATETTPGDETDAGGGTQAPAGKTVGVAMPTQTSERWIADGNAVKDGLEAAGFKVNLQFANDDIPTQQQQLDNMITTGVDVLIVAPIDGTALANQLQAAADQGIPVISYDRLIRDTENVDFYVTFDNEQVGVEQAKSLLQGLGIMDSSFNIVSGVGPKTIELFAGSLDDNNAHFFWKGAMDTLQPLIDDGTLVVGSGQKDIEQAAILRWSQETAQRRMEDLLTAHYGGGSGQLDGILSPFDGISRGVITALQNAGYGPTIAEGMPIVTGQDAEIASVKLIVDDVQYSTIFKDTRKLADQAVAAATDFANGKTPTANDTETYDNGMKIVPSYLLEVDVVTKDNVQSVLVDSGYWTQDQIDRGQA